MRKLVIALKSLLMAACAVAIFGVITWGLRRLDPFIPLELPAWVAVGGIRIPLPATYPPIRHGGPSVAIRGQKTRPC